MYRGTLLIRKRTPLGPLSGSRHGPKVLEGGVFFWSEVPLQGSGFRVSGIRLSSQGLGESG